MQHRRLLCTDLDRTLIPNGHLPESAWSAKVFQSLVDREEIALAFVTGRHLELVQQAIEEYRLPWPDFVLGDVGSSIYIRQSPSGSAAQVPQFLRDTIHDHTLSAEWPDETVKRLRKLLAQQATLVPQEASKQARFKLSYYLSAAVSLEALERELRMRLQAEQIEANLILSTDTETGQGLLDVLPPEANKLKAIEYLMEERGYAHGDVLFAGDSGNDIDVFASPIQSVMVANAPAELKEQSVRGCWPACMIARGMQMPDMWCQKWSSWLHWSPEDGDSASIEFNGNYRAGIIEGMFHYWPETSGWLPKQASAF